MLIISDMQGFVKTLFIYQPKGKKTTICLYHIFRVSNSIGDILTSCGMLYIKIFISDKFVKFTDLREVDVLEHQNVNSIYTAMTSFQTERNIFQQGLFTLSPNIMGDHELIIDEILSNADKKGYHFKLIIPNELKIEFLARLKSMNISADILFRNLDGLGESLSHIVDFRGWKNY